MPPRDELLPAGAVVTSAVLGLAASVGYDHLQVHPLPSVTTLVTGDEFSQAGLPGQGYVRDAIGPMLPGLVRACGGVTRGAPVRLADDPAALRSALTHAGDADVMAVCGASSHGPADYLRDVLAEVEAEILVDGVACRPGHPQLLARVGERRFAVGLPGNPYAAFVAALTLLVPLIAKLAGRQLAALDRIRLDGNVTAHPRDTRLVAVRVDGRRAQPVGCDRPGMLWGAACADALAVVPPGWNGEDVELLTTPASQGSRLA